MLITIPAMISEPYDVYRARPKMSSHELQMFAKCPQHYKKYKDGVITDREETSSLKVGRATHTLILEGSKVFADQYATGGPINEKTGALYGAATKKYKEWAAEQDKEILTPSDFGLVEAMGKSVREHTEANYLLAKGKPEQVILADWNGVECKSRLDWVNGGTIVDLKTTRSLDTFPRDFKAFGYGFQLGFYTKMLELYGVKLEGCFVIAVEKSQPFRTAVYELSRDVILDGQREANSAILRFAACSKQEHWPTDTEGMRYIEL